MTREETVSHCLAAYKYLCMNCNVKYKHSPRMDLLLAYSLVAQTHTASILRLIKMKGADSSALALMRPMVETCCRGLWLYHVAPDNVVEEFWTAPKAGFPKYWPDLLKDLFSHYPEDHFYFARRAWNNMNGMTHTARQQVMHCFDKDGNISSNYPESLIRGTAKTAIMLLAMHVMKVLLLLGREDRVQDIKAYFDEFRRLVYPPRE
jgi:hypothetical protein